MQLGTPQVSTLRLIVYADDAAATFVSQILREMFSFAV
jgi:hypothetical protein